MRSTSRDQPVADVVEAGATVLLGDGRAQQADLAHLAEDRHVGALVAEDLGHARRDLALRGVAHHPFVGGELLVEQQRVIPMKGGSAHGFLLA